MSLKLSSKKIFSEYSKRYSLKLHQVKKERDPNFFLSGIICFNSRLGDLGEAIAKAYLSENGFVVFEMGGGMFEKSDENIPDKLIHSPAVEAYAKIDKFLFDYCNASTIHEHIERIIEKTFKISHEYFIQLKKLGKFNEDPFLEKILKNPEELKNYWDWIYPDDRYSSVHIKKYDKQIRKSDSSTVITTIETDNLSNALSIEKFIDKEIKIIKIYKKAKFSGLFNIKEFESAFYGSLDFMAEKNNTISFFEVKTNTSQLVSGQKMRMVWLSQHNVPTKVVRIHVKFDSTGNQLNNNILVKVPFKKNFTFGLIVKKSESLADAHLISEANITVFDYYRKAGHPIDPKEVIYLIKLVEIPQMLAYPQSQIEKLDYTLEFEKIKKDKLRMPTEKEIENVSIVIKTLYGREISRGGILIHKFFDKNESKDENENNSSNIRELVCSENEGIRRAPVFCRKCGNFIINIDIPTKKGTELIFSIECKKCGENGEVTITTEDVKKDKR